MLTNDDIRLIESLIDKRIQASTKPATAQRDYHTTPEIRKLITDNLEHLCEELGEESFELGTIRYLLSKLTVLRPGDHELIGCTDHAQPRWEQQVGQVIASPHWATGQNPFERVKGRRGHYRLIHPSLTLF
jgi:hypothetical protein